jgi:glutathione S-transferase
MYCSQVLRVARRLGVDFEVRSIVGDPEAAAELYAETGRTTVPVLRVDRSGDKALWLPESADIIAYLYREFGQGKTPRIWDGVTPQMWLTLATLGAIGLDHVLQPQLPWVWVIPLATFVVVLRR